MLIRARVILPIGRPPIDNGAVRIAGNRIVAIGHARSMAISPGDASVDLGDVIVMPGLVNAHCHLDYTHLAGVIPAQKRFTDWINLITSIKAGWSYTEFAASWVEGARMLLQTGTTTVGDIETAPELLPEVWSSTPLRVFSFLEMTGVKSRRDPGAILREAVDRIESLPASRGGAGLSPHAPYSTVPELLRQCGNVSHQTGWRLTIHVAESALEFEMFTQGRGDMFHWLRRNERDMSDCGLGTPIQHLERCGVLRENLLAVHANCLGADDAALLARREVSVAHCPTSHAYFNHPPFPRDELAAAGVNLCLGTDSLASVTQKKREPARLSMFDEMRLFAMNHSTLSPEIIVRMATTNAARALGLSGRAGELVEDAWADLIALPFDDGRGEAYEAVVHHTGPIRASMIDGEWAIAPN